MQTQRTIEELRSDLSEKVAELHRRAKRAKEVVTPSTYLRSPWLKVGLVALAGLAILERRRAPRAYEGVAHAVVRSALSAAVGALVTRALLPAAATEAEYSAERTLVAES